MQTLKRGLSPLNPRKLDLRFRFARLGDWVPQIPLFECCESPQCVMRDAKMETKRESRIYPLSPFSFSVFRILVLALTLVLTRLIPLVTILYFFHIFLRSSMFLFLCYAETNDGETENGKFDLFLFHSELSLYSKSSLSPNLLASGRKL